MNSSAPPSPLREAAAQHLRAHHSQLLQRWVQRVVQELPALDARGPRLLGRADSLLERFQGALLAGAGVLPPPPPSSSEQPLGSGQALRGAFQELRLLRQVIFASLEEAGPVPEPVRETLLEVVEREQQQWLEDSLRDCEVVMAGARVAQEEAQVRWSALHDAFRQAPAFLTVYRGPNHVIEFTSAESLGLFGRDTRGKPAREAMPEFAAQGILRILDEVYATGEPFYSWELRGMVDRTGDGRMKECFFNSRTRALRDASGSVIGIISHSVDVTEEVLSRRQETEALRVMDLEQVAREQSMAALVHDLRTPLSLALMSTQAIAREPHNLEKIAVMSARVEKGLHRADQMLQQLLDVRRQSSAEHKPELAECELRELLTRCIEELAQLHGVSIALQAPERIHGVWDCEGIRRIIENLVGNAVKYGEPHKPVTVSLSRHEQLVRLIVHNWGPPLMATELGSIFQPYHRSNTAEQGGQKGWGIGLMLVRSMAEAHGGHVHATSSTSRGTTFTVELPLDSRPFTKTGYRRA